jgi:hypothetical protein
VGWREICRSSRDGLCTSRVLKKASSFPRVLYICCHVREGGHPGFKGYRALRARSQNLIAGGSAPAPWVTFLCLSKEKRPKERHPGWREYPLCFSPKSALASTRRAHAPGARRSAARPFGGMEVHRTSMNTPPYPRAQTRGSLLPIPAAMLGRAIRGLEQHLALPDFHSAGLAGFVGSVNTASPYRLIT